MHSKAIQEAGWYILPELLPDGMGVMPRKEIVHWLRRMATARYTKRLQEKHQTCETFEEIRADYYADLEAMDERVEDIMVKLVLEAI